MGWPHQFCLQFLDRRLDGADVGPAQRVDEISTGLAGDLRALALRNRPTVVPEDRRSQPEVACEWIVRTPNGNIVSLEDGIVMVVIARIPSPS
jgi:hypothetical protein